MEKQLRKQLQQKTGILLAIIFLIFVFLAARLFYLQVVNAEEFQAQSEDNRTRFLSIPARRGDILDKNGQVLATSKPVFSVKVSDIGEYETREVLGKIVEIVGDPEVTEESLEEKLKENYRPYEPAQVLRIPWNEESLAIVSRLEARRRDLPGVSIEEEPMRYYPDGALFGHLLGYVNNINKEELEKYKEFQYGINDRIGKSGLEAILEQQLRGKKGARQVEVNAQSTLVRELLTIPPTPGNNVILTVDAEMQKVLSRSLDEQIAIAVENANAKGKGLKVGGGAGVVLDVRTGAILAIVSKPDLNPNDFIENIAYTSLKDYYRGPLAPELNRAVSSAYPPGSTFKPITGLAALESGKISVNDPPIYDSGTYWKPPYIKCWKPGGHGSVNFYQAFAYSCNTWFQYAADIAGVQELIRVAREFGLGKPTGSPDVTGEVSGLLPTPDWKKAVGAAIINGRYDKKRQQLEARYNELIAQAQSEEERQRIQKDKAQESRQLETSYKIDYNWETTWHPYDTFNMSIGQGSNSFTILQLASFTATLANGGQRLVPYLVDRIVSPEDKVLEQRETGVSGQINISPANLAEVRKGMRAVTQPGGTAYGRFSDFPSWATTAAKTGSAQTGDEDVHGLFIGFAPYENPEIAVAVIVEYGESGSGSAGFVARDVFSHYYGLDQEK